MSKLSGKDAEALVKSGMLSKKSVEAMENKGFVSKKRESVKRFMKTADGQWVSPTLYFRGGKNTKLSKRQNEFVNKFNSLLKEYTTIRK